jgi:hypothetical protein
MRLAPMESLPAAVQSIGDQPALSVRGVLITAGGDEVTLMSYAVVDPLPPVTQYVGVGLGAAGVGLSKAPVEGVLLADGNPVMAPRLLTPPFESICRRVLPPSVMAYR